MPENKKDKTMQSTDSLKNVIIETGYTSTQKKNNIVPFLTKRKRTHTKQIKTPIYLYNQIFGRNLKAELKAELIKSLRVHSIFIAIVFSYLAICIVTAVIYNATDKISLSFYSKPLFIITGFFLSSVLIWRAAYIILFVRPQRLTRYILNDWRVNYLNAKCLLNALPILLVLPLFMSAFQNLKTMIPIVNPFSWDYTFARWDAVIHGGTQAWQLLHPIFGYPLVTSILNFVYNIWLYVMFAVLLWQAFSLRDCRLRMQFFLTYILSWVLLGTLVAMIFSSAGPCFYERVVEGEDIFQPLMQYLRSAKESFPVWAIDAQEMLWKSYEGYDSGYVNGISAMPSMHISMAFLFILVGWRAHRIAGVLFTIYAILLMIGCVHLGWHYAIDAYIAIVCTWLIWLGSGKVLIYIPQISQIPLKI